MEDNNIIIEDNEMIKELFSNCYVNEITQKSDLGHTDILNIAKLLIFYCSKNLETEISINNNVKYKNNYFNLMNILQLLDDNIKEHNTLN